MTVIDKAKLAVGAATGAGVPKKFRWVILAFIFAGLLVSGLLIWQLYETQPSMWCAVADVNEVSAEGCFELLLGLINVKDHAIIGLLFILGVTVLSVVAVTLRVRLDLDGPGGTGANIEGDE